MRLFFALQPSVTDCRSIDDWRGRVFPPFAHPVPAQNLHITLAFLGDVKAARREQLEDAASSLTSPTLTVNLDQLGYFPRAGILWVGPALPPPPLLALAKAVDSAARRIGVRTEKQRYRPHLTLARRCQTPPPASALSPNFVFSFDEFVLFESVSGRSGISYHALASWPLA